MNAFYLENSPLWEQDDSWQGFQWLCADDNNANTVSFLRWDRKGTPLIVVCNFSPEHRDGYRVGAPFGGSWAVAFNTDDAAFGGQGLGDKAPIKTEKIPCHDQQQSFTIDLPPMSAVILRCVRKNPVRKPKAEADKKSEAKAEKKPAAKKAPKAAPKAEKAPAKKAASKAEKAPAADKPKRTRAKKTDQ